MQRLNIKRASACRVPNAHQVVIGPACQMASIAVPLQATHFLSVQFQRARVMLSYSHVMSVYVARTRSGCEHVRVPRQAANARIVRLHLSQARFLVYVPQFDHVLGVAHCQYVAFLNPRHGRDVVGRVLVHREQL